MNTKPMSFHEAYAAILDPDAILKAVGKIVRRMQESVGNAKARRRWRRRDIPNRQRSAPNAKPSRWKIEGNSIIGPRLSEVVQK